jgi:hypothetical protein
VALVGLHAVLIRREVFEKQMAAKPDIPLDYFEFFWYPRHEKISEDAAFSEEVGNLGVKIGATTAVKTGHISRVTTGWQTYQEYLKLSGTIEKWERYYELVELVADFMDESYDTVIANAIRGSENTRKSWNGYKPISPDHTRAFYGKKDNGYVYDLISWNCSPLYHKITAPRG